MWVLVCLQCKLRFKVSCKKGRLWMFLDERLQCLINFSLILLTLLRWNVFLFFLGKDVTLSAFCLLLLWTLEVVVVDVFGQFETLKINAGTGGNDVPLGNTTQWAGVKIEGSIDQQKSRAENLK